MYKTLIGLDALYFQMEYNVLVYSFQRIIRFCQEHHYLFAAQCVWWLSSLLGLQGGLVIHNENPRIRDNIGGREVSVTPQDTETDSGIPLPKVPHQPSQNLNWVSEPLQQTWTGHVNLSPTSKSQLRRARKSQLKRARKFLKIMHSIQMDRLDLIELQRRKAAGECQRCALPSNQEGAQRTTECF